MTLKNGIVDYGSTGIIIASIIIGAVSGFSYLLTRDPLIWLHPKWQDPNVLCGEGIHVTHNGQPIANLAVKQLGSGTTTWGSTNSTGYFMLSFCQPVGTIITFQATDYGFQMEPHQLIEAAL